MSILNLFKKNSDAKVLDIVEESLKGLCDLAGFDLSYELQFDGKSQVLIELHGEDEELLKERGGALLSSIQLLVERTLQHNNENKKIYVKVDSNKFNDEVQGSLIRVADKLKKKALSENKPQLFKPLDPKKRKMIHEYLSEDKRIKTKSVGDGYFKKIKISVNRPRSSNEQKT